MFFGRAFRSIVKRNALTFFLNFLSRIGAVCSEDGMHRISQIVTGNCLPLGARTARMSPCSGHYRTQQSVTSAGTSCGHSWQKAVLGAGLVVAVVLSGAYVAGATTIMVDSTQDDILSGHCTLREAVFSANQQGGGNCAPGSPGEIE